MPNEAASPALVFDVGGVLVAHDNEMLFERLASRCSAPDALEHVRKGSRGTSNGERSVRDIHRALIDGLAYSGDWETFKSDWCCHFAFDGAMMELARKLAAANRLVLFSNTNNVHWDYVRAADDGALKRFESYASHEIGAAKPDIEAYEKVARLANIDPERSIFVDDLAANVEGARKAGFAVHQFQGKSPLERFLRESGIHWSP